MGEMHVLPTSEPKPPSYLIVGAGVFGASTAYHLIQRYPNASVTLVDRGLGANEAAASWDWQKVVRAEYEDYFYMSMALEALDEWRTNQLFKPFFHQSGAIWMMKNADYAQTIAENYKKSGREVDYEVIGSEELKKRYDGIFAGADLEGVGEIFVSPGSGWASAKEALSAVIAEGVKLGVNNVALDVEKLEFNEAGACIGVTGKNGTKLTAEKVLVTAGTFTASLLADSAPHRKDIQVDERFVSTGVSTALLQLDEARQKRLKDAPVFVHNVAETMGEFLPVQGGFLKFNNNMTFKNTTFHTALGQKITAPPSGPNYLQWTTTPEKVKQELDIISRNIFGNLTEGLSFVQHRICWDAYTATTDFFVTPHPRSRNLYIATAGSLHGWKFLPVIGKYVVKMLEGELDDDTAARWAWDREIPGTRLRYAPRRELKDLADSLAELKLKDIAE